MIGFQPYLFYLVACLGALAVSLFSIPNIIYVARKKRLLDIPDNHRKLHKRIVPNLGGIGIFFAYIIATSLFIRPEDPHRLVYEVYTKWNFIVAASLILFVTGLKDDLVSISPSKKFVAQFAAALLTAWFADIRITSLHGLLGIYDLPDWASIPFTVVGCMFVTNAFNLIDGIDGLAGTIGVFISLTFGIFLAMEGNTNAAIIAFSLMGAILGFLRFNLAPAKIFMGDTGSLIIGFMVSVVSILFVKSYDAAPSMHLLIPAKSGTLIIALSVLFIPVFDTFRVFGARIVKGHSPFRADRTHLHHYLLDLGLSHSQTVSVLLVANILIVCFSLAVQEYNINGAIASLVFVVMGLYGVLVYLRRTRLAPPAQQPHPVLSAAVTNGIPHDQIIQEEGPGNVVHINHLTVEGNKILIEEHEEAMAGEE